MLCTLKELKPNPLRDFTIDPLDDDVVDKLKLSIKEDGFWGGVVARKAKGGEIQVAAGWHRVKAAIKAGVERADIYVMNDMDDARLIRVYARENATQRGNNGTALAGTIAAAIRYLAKEVMKGSAEISRTSHELKTAQGNLASDRGIGWELVLRFLEDIPGINQNIVKQQLAILKSSGDYARIIDQIREEIERENKEAIKALEKAEREYKEAQAFAAEALRQQKELTAKAKAAKEEAAKKNAEYERQYSQKMAELAAKREAEAEKERAKFDALRVTVNTARSASQHANGHEVTFDFEGTAKHFSNPSHIETFRKVVTGDGIKPYLPIKKQSELAAELARKAKAAGVELTSSFIKDNIGALVHSVVVANKKIQREDAERLRRKNWDSQWHDYQRDFSRSSRGMVMAAMKMSKHAKSRPDGVTLLMTAEFRDNLKKAKEAIKLIEGVI